MMQVSSRKASGESVKLSLPLSQMPATYMLRNASEYDYDEDYYDDDDYEDNQEDKVRRLIKPPMYMTCI
jgi:hypothetical protein